MTVPPPPPSFRDPAFLTQHIKDILAFYHPRCVDHARGGFFHFFRDDGSVYDADTRHLVSSARFVVNYAIAYRLLGKPAHLDAARHGLAFLRSAHLDRAHGGYAWLLDRDGVSDGTKHCYGHAFVLLAYARALEAGIAEAAPLLDETWNVLSERFWSEQDGLFCDEISQDWRSVSLYRGQNANMHACEAMLAAFEATGEGRYLERAAIVARRVTCDLAAQSGGMIWEHYDPSWQIDWNYNRDNPKHLFRPWGFQPGHQTEWAKLLLTLDRHLPADWHLDASRRLFDAAAGPAWDPEYGGLVYGLAPGGGVCDDDKYFWVQAETLAASAALARRSGNDRYWGWYDRIWSYCWDNMIDHRFGAWFRILDRQNGKLSDEKSPAGKTDYHTLGACWEVLNC